jgi:Tfp pilus assembly PilM family ATPase
MKKQIGKIKLPVSGKKTSLGVALEDHLVSYVEATATPSGISISRFGEVALETDSGDKEQRTAELTHIFKNIHHRSKTKALRIALPDSTATFFEMTLPESDPFLLEHMVEREIKKATGDRHDFVMQTEILYREKNNTKVAVTMLPQLPIDDMKALAKQTDFNLEYVGLSTEIVAELISLDDAASIIVAIKAHETSITILSKGSLVLEEVVATGTDVWIQKIVEQLGVSKESAEEALFFDGISLTSTKNAVLQCLRGELHKLIQAAEKTFLYWHVDCRKEKECRVRQVTLIGGGATIPGMASYLETALHIETRNPEPFKNIPLANEIPELTEAESLKYLPALALALKGLRK